MANTSPILTLRNSIAPYNTISPIVYLQQKDAGFPLPVNEGFNFTPEQSTKNMFRIYNNFALSSNIADALNIQVTTFDTASAGSHSASTSPVSQQWVHMQQTGFGQASSGGGNFSSYLNGNDIAVGGLSVFSPERGSDGSPYNPTIRAGYINSGAGVGFIELTTYLSFPSGNLSQTYNFVIGVLYNWST